MTDFEIIGPYAIALLMSLGALCVFVWGVLSGAFERCRRRGNQILSDGDGK